MDIDYAKLGQVVVAGLSAGAVYAMVGLGYNVVFAATRVFNFAQGQMLMLGIMLTWQFRDEWGWPAGLAVLAAVLTVGVANVAVERVGVAPLVRSGSRAGGAGHGTELASLITTLGISIAMLNLTIIHWGPDTKPFSPYFPFTGMNLGGVTITRQQILMVAVALALTFGYRAFTSFTRWGVGLSAMAEDSGAAALRGVPVGRGRMLAFLLAGIISGAAGAAIGPITGADPAVGFGFGLKGFVAIAIGGFGSTTGALVGGMVLGLTEAATTTYWDDRYRVYAGLALVLVVLMVRPRGLFGRVALREV